MTRTRSSHQHLLRRKASKRPEDEESDSPAEYVPSEPPACIVSFGLEQEMAGGVKFLTPCSLSIWDFAEGPRSNRVTVDLMD